MSLGVVSLWWPDSLLVHVGGRVLVKLISFDILHSDRSLGNRKLMTLGLLMMLKSRDLLWAHHRSLGHLRMSWH